MLHHRLRAAATKGPKTLTFVGGKVTAPGGLDTWVTLSLTSGFLGGIGSKPSPGDLVICQVFGLSASTVSMSGWTELINDIDTGVRRCVFYKFMSNPVDSTATATFSNDYGRAMVCQIWRNANPTTPFGTVATAYGTGSATNAPAVTPAVDQATILAFGVSASFNLSSLVSPFTKPSNMDVLTGVVEDSSVAAIATAAKTGATTSAFDPDAFGGGASTSANIWAAATVALYPQT